VKRKTLDALVVLASILSAILVFSISLNWQGNSIRIAPIAKALYGQLPVKPQTSDTKAAASSSSSSSVQIQAGGGNSTIPYTVYNPATAQIKTGQTVMWYNPSVAPEPHTVTFALDNSTRPELSATFAVRNSSSFMPILPNSTTTSQPVIIPNPQNPSMTTILASNSIASGATVIDSAGNVKHLGSNAAYSIKGDEKLVNSGMLFPKGMGPPNGSTTFTLTFEKAGTYDYYCILHPWQKGKIAVQ
jgi:plastocyanin